MAKGKKGKKGTKKGSSSRGRKKATKASGRRRSSGRRWKVHMPTMLAVKIAAAIIVGGVIADVLEELGYDVIPDQLSPKAASLWAYGWYRGDALMQQFAYGLELDHVAEENDLTDAITEQVTEMLEGFGLGGDALPPGDEDDEIELDELEDGVGVG